jgi:two-component system, chemotaxis family, sensor kinase CheA
MASPVQPPDQTLVAIKLVFFQECEELLAELEAGLLALQSGEHDDDTVNSAFRAVHSIKGGAAAFGLDGLIQFAHHFESALAELRSSALAPSPALLNTLLRAADALADCVRAARDGRPLPADRAQAAEAELDQYLEVERFDELDDFAFDVKPVVFEAFEEDAAPVQSWNVRLRPYADLYLKANEPLLLLRELQRLGDVEIILDETRTPLLSDLAPEEAYLAWNIVLRTAADEQAIRAVFEFVESDCDLEITRAAETAQAIEVSASFCEAPAPASSATEETPLAKIDTPAAPHAAPAPTIRVDLERVDRLVDLVSELVINKAMLVQRAIDAGFSGRSSMTTALDDLDRLTRDLQESVMAIRAQPVKPVFQRLSRLVREVEAATGKQVRLISDGESTEVDRTVVERLTDPLTHLVRNAIDHGLETPDVRLAAGKPAQGIVRVSAAHQGGRVILTVSDDGAGIDRSRVRAIAEQRGLVAADAVLTEEEINNLIFAPGFSTASTVSNLSGRGVGMDVAKRSIEALGGRISIASVTGKGSTITLSLPLTLAVLDGMVVSVCGQLFVVPLTALIETTQLAADAMHPLGANAALLAIRGAHVGLADLGVVLGFRSISSLSPQSVALLVETDAGERLALAVDEILDQRQVVIKSLEANYQPVAGIAAATILGDGRVAFILDVNGIVLSLRRAAAAERRSAAA